MWVLDLLLITFVICFIIDISGIIESMKKFISIRLLGFKSIDFSIKPLDCSLCMTWWTGLIYIYIIGQMNILGVFIVAMFSFMASNVTVLMYAIKDLIGVLINKIIDYANSI